MRKKQQQQKKSQKNENKTKQKEIECDNFPSKLYSSFDVIHLQP